MSLVKNEIPILEYDTEKTAVLMPERHQNYKFPEKAVLLFMDSEIDQYIATHNCQIVGKFVSITKTFCVYETTVKNQKFAFVQAPFGGARSVQIMEQMIAGGTQK